jgi:tRNA dimethylallyltransferase
MIGVASPFESYSAARYVVEAARAVDGVLARGGQPILVGGTGLYIDSLLTGRGFAPRDEETRRALEARYDARGGETLLAELAGVDPETAARVAPGDRRRIVRALEIHALTGATAAAHDERTRQAPPRYDFIRYALTFRDRAALYARIDARVDRMMAAGLLREVEALLDMGVPRGGTAMQAIGYKELADALSSGGDIPEAVALIKRRSRNYAKRQLTWLRARPDTVWLEWGETPDFDGGLQILTENSRREYYTDRGADRR